MRQLLLSCLKLIVLVVVVAAAVYGSLYAYGRYEVERLAIATLPEYSDEMLSRVSRNMDVSMADLAAILGESRYSYLSDGAFWLLRWFSTEPLGVSVIISLVLILLGSWLYLPFLIARNVKQLAVIRAAQEAILRQIESSKSEQTQQSASSHEE